MLAQLYIYSHLKNPSIQFAYKLLQSLMPIADVINVIYVHHAGYKYVLLFKKETVDVAINDATFPS